MDSEIAQLAEAARSLASATDGPVAERAARLAERLAGRRFNITVVGEFKRGKSTLINALVGQPVLPIGVLPLTAVATEVSFGPPGAVVVKHDGEQVPVALDGLRDYVTEAGNPENIRGVKRVEVQVASELLRPGVVLVDTPGIGSVYLHNDEAARQALLDADGAILVLSADAPLSESERGLLKALSERQAPTFFVLNKIDHLSPQERDEVSDFVDQVMSAQLGRQERLWLVDARAALAERIEGRSPSEDHGNEIGALLGQLEAFVRLDLVQARLETARRELGRLSRQLTEGLTLEAAAAELDAETLAGRVAHFEQAAMVQRSAFEDERTLLRRDVVALSEEVGRRLAERAREAAGRSRPTLAVLARNVPVRGLEEALDHAVEAEVRAGFEELRAAESDRVDEAWRQLAARTRDRTQDRVNEVRAAAAELFSVDLPEIAIPEVAEERERFFYLFLHIGSPMEGLGRMARRLLPGSAARRRLLKRAEERLSNELDKHAGRARWDLGQRLDAVRSRFELAMAAELEQSIDMILEAARLANQARAEAESDRERRSRDHRQALEAARSAQALAG